MTTANSQIERNWAIWHRYRTTDASQRDLAREFGLTASRVGGVCQYIDRRIDWALGSKYSPGPKRFVRSSPKPIYLMITDQLSDIPTHRRPWHKAGGQLYNPWTGTPIPEAAKYFTRSDDSVYYWRIALPGEEGSIALTKPKNFDEEAAADRPVVASIDPQTPIELLPLSTRTRNCLLNDNYKVLADILAFDEEALQSLLNIPNFGKVSLAELREFFGIVTRPEDSTSPLEKKLRSYIEELKQANEELRRQLAAKPAPTPKPPKAEEFRGGELRDWFAGQALVGWLADGSATNCEEVAAEAYAFADAMLAARQQKGG
jgi:hypothetical protein